MVDDTQGNHTSIPTSDDGLLNFRAMWLRVVAEAWFSDQFKADLLHSPAAEEILKRSFGYSWLWDGVLTLKVVDSADCSWIGTDWVWPCDPTNGEGMKIYVPLSPPKNATPEQYATALADYYRVRPSLLVTAQQFPAWSITAFDGPWNRQINLLAARSSKTTAAALPIPSPSPQGGFVPASVDFANFEVALLFAISRAWKSAEFRTFLLRNEKFAIATCHGYEAPWVLPVTIADGGALEWRPQERTWVGFWPNELTIGLPPAPVDLSERVMAIAAYNATGAQFPFTCCP